MCLDSLKEIGFYECEFFLGERDVLKEDELKELLEERLIKLFERLLGHLKHLLTLLIVPVQIFIIPSIKNLVLFVYIQ